METQKKADLAMAGLVHDLNNVFMTILDAAGLLGADPQWMPVAACLERSVGRGRRILNSFFERGGDAPVSVAEVADSAIEFARDVLRSHGAEVAFERNIQTGLRLNGSPIAWERALFNLLTNAGQAARGGHVKLHARSLAGWVEITVLDDGPGIPQEALPRIFDPGFSTEAEHAGLGLHIARSIVRQAGGEITAANRVHGGAMVRIMVPEYPGEPGCG